MNYSAKNYYTPMPVKSNVPSMYAPNTNELDTRNVFADDTGDMPIKYTCDDDVPMGGPSERMFTTKCPKKVNHFFYPQDIQKFFGQNEIPGVMPQEPCCNNLTYYNKAWNHRHTGTFMEIISDTTCDESFFNDNSGPMFSNECQTEPLRSVKKYVSAYDKKIDRISCEPLCCNKTKKRSIM
jgi:hypothetical protein